MISRVLRSPFFHTAVLIAVYIVVFSRTTIFPQDDHFHYQAFMQALSQGSLDFSIPGFHGASFLAFPVYLLTGSELSSIYFQLLCSLLLIPTSYLAALSLLKDRFQSVLFMYCIALMPFFSFLAFRGFTFSSFTLMVLLTLWLWGKGSIWAALPLGISFIIKPFSIALFPLFLLWPFDSAQDKRLIRRGWFQLCLALLVPALYVTIEYLQIGRIIVGAHSEIDQTNVFLLDRLPLNIAHGVQMLFSIHNFYFPDPARTGLGNMTHGSPLLMVLGIFALLYPKNFWKDQRLAGVLLFSATCAFFLAASLDHMDHFYLETVTIILTLGAIPLLARHRLFIPFALFTFHFHFLYLYLNYRDVFFHNTSLFWIVGLIDGVAFLSWLVLVAPDLRLKQLIDRWY